MTRLTGALLIVICFASAAMAQGKGVDKGSERVRDTGSSRLPANNGSKTDVGTAAELISEEAALRTSHLFQIPTASQFDET